MDCFTRPISAHFARGKSQFVRDSASTRTPRLASVALRQALADFVAQEFSVDGLAFQLGARRFDHRAHLFR